MNLYVYIFYIMNVIYVIKIYMSIESFIAKSPEYGTLSSILDTRMNTRYGFTFFSTLGLKMGFVDADGTVITCLVPNQTYYAYIQDSNNVKKYLTVNSTPNGQDNNIVASYPYFNMSSNFDTSTLSFWIYSTRDQNNIYTFELFTPVENTYAKLIISLDLTGITFVCACTGCLIGQWCNQNTATCQDCEYCGQGNGTCYGICDNNNDLCAFITNTGIYQCKPYINPEPQQPQPQPPNNGNGDNNKNTTAIIIGVIVIFVFFFIAALFITLAIKGSYSTLTSSTKTSEQQTLSMQYPQPLLLPT